MKKIFLSVKEWLFVGLLLIAGSTLFLYKLQLVSSTYDEPIALLDAKHVVTDFRWDSEGPARYPPLAHYIYGWAFRGTTDAEFETRLYWARLFLLPVYLIGAVAMYLVIKRLYGAMAAVTAVVLYIFHPEILAHARFLKYDVLTAVTMFGSVVTLYAFLTKPAFSRMALAGFCLGLTLLAKSIALVLLPLYLVYACIFFLKRSERKKILLGLAGIYVVSLVFLHAGYLFSETGRIPAVWQSRKLGYVANNPLTRPWLYLLPRAYLWGLDEATRISEGKYWGFLAGEYFEDGRWYFFPVVFLIKTPLPFLLLLGAAITLWILKKLPTPPYMVPLVLLIVLAYFLYFMFLNRINNGLRYLLFVYPLLILIMTPLWEVKVVGKTRQVLRAVIVLLLVWYAIKTVSIAPFYLAFANESIGGPKNLWKYVADSSIDWGQDDNFFAEYQRLHPEVIVNPPLLTSGLIAVNVNTLNLETRYQMHWLRKLHQEPVAEVGYTWLIFDVKPQAVK